MKRYFKYILCFCIVSVLLVGCSNNNKNEQSIQAKLIESISKTNIRHEKIYHFEIVKDGVVVFYKYQNNLNAGFIRNTSDGWKWVFGGGSASIEPEDGLSWCATNDEDTPLYYSYGIIRNPDIEQVRTKSNNNNEKHAKITTTDEGVKIWFTFYENPIDSPFDITGLSRTGEILYQYPSYPNIIFRK